MQKGSGIHSKTSDGETALFLAALEGKVETVQFLLDAKPDTEKTTKNGQTVLFAAAHNNHSRTVECLLEAGAEVDVCGDAETALGTAAYGGRLGIVDRLLKQGADAKRLGLGLTPCPYWVLQLSQVIKK
jgi:uncharacterized protein